MEGNVKETVCQQLPKILIEIIFVWFIVVKSLMKNIDVVQLYEVLFCKILSLEIQIK